MWLQRLIILLAGAVVAAPGSGGIVDFSQSNKLRYTVEYYDVSGSTWSEIRKALFERGIKAEDGVTRFAHTKWKVKWKWPRPYDGAIDVNGVSVAAEAEILLPRLVDLGVATSTRTEWNEFLAKMLEHELHHLSHLRTNIGGVKKAVLGAKNSDGYVSPISANKAAHRVVRKIRSLDEAYDRITVHGREEGIVTPGA